jgi:glycosyltransferase involved in cell wall biosynthesis
MNILILNWRDKQHPKSGGAEIVTMEHAKYWVKLGNQVTWLTSSYNGAKASEYIDGVKIVRHAGSHTIYIRAPFYLLTQSYQFDVIVDEIHGIPFFSPLFTRKPVVVFIHEIAGDIWDFMYPKPLNYLGKFLENLYFKIYQKHLFWTDAQSTAEELINRGILRNNCTAIPCPVTLKKDYLNNLKPKCLNPTYIFVSRVVQMKGIEEVIKSFSFILKEQSNSQLWIVGSGEDKYIDKLKGMITEYGAIGNVKFWGKVSEDKKYELMSQAQVLLHASVKEGWGLVVLEAAAFGTPSIVYNVPGLKDIVVNDETGIIISDNSPQKMAAESIKLVNDKKRYAKFQENCKKRVNDFTWEKSANQSLNILKKAIQQRIYY